MTVTSSIPTEISSAVIKQNWPLVGTLFVLTAIPGIPAILIVLLVLIGPIESPLLMSLINASYFESPLAVLVHGSSGIAFFLSVPFQFAAAFRQKHPKWHRMSGRIALLSAYTMAGSGLWMHQVLTPNETGMRYIGLLTVSLGMVVTFSLALYFVLTHRIEAHRRWMYRAVAITLAVVTPLLIEIVAAFTFGQVEMFKPLLAQFLHNYDRLMALGLNLLIAQLLLRENMGEQRFKRAQA